MLSPIRAQCLLALFSLGGWAMRAGFQEEEADTSVATVEGAYGGAKAAAAAAAQHAAEHAEKVYPNGAFFVFVEVYQLLGTDSSQSSKAISGFDVADNLLQMAENASEAQRRVPLHRAEAVSGHDVADNLLEVAQNSSMVPIYHSEVTICPRASFLPEQVHFLTNLAANMGSFEEVQRQDWVRMQVQCEGLSWGGGGITHYGKLLSQSMSGIGNADLDKVWKYFYGTSGRPATWALGSVAGGKCDGFWRPDCYHPIHQNCNFFVNVVMYCGFELSSSMPNIHLSALKRVTTCRCLGLPRTWC